MRFVLGLLFGLLLGALLAALLAAQSAAQEHEENEAFGIDERAAARSPVR